MNEVTVHSGQIVRHDIDLDYPNNHDSDGMLFLVVSFAVLIIMFLWRKP